MYAWIDNIVVGLFDSYNTHDVCELYDNLNIKIKNLSPDNILLRGNDSLYFRDYLNTEIVFIRDDLILETRKFILFHELAHALLHTNILESRFNRSCINNGKLEKQANYFAFKMLNTNVNKIDLEGMSLEQIATYIGVPYTPLAQIINL